VTSARVVFVLDGRPRAVSAGGVLGRSPRAALPLQGSGVSELHAYVSLRGKALRLLALRGRVEVDGEACDDIELEPGQVLRLGSVLLDVDDVVLPDRILLVHGLGPHPVVVEDPEASLWTGPPPRLGAGHHQDADLLLTQSTSGWSVTPRCGQPQALPTDLALPPLRLQLAPLGAQGSGTTTTAARAGLEITFCPSRVELRGPDGQELVLHGRLFELLDVLRAMKGEPTRWEELVGMIWEEQEVDPRENFKRLTRRLRNRLVQAGIREDLVRSDGRGRWWWRPLPEDVVRQG
jgi:hypothetical protein